MSQAEFSLTIPSPLSGKMMLEPRIMDMNNSKFPVKMAMVFAIDKYNRIVCGGSLIKPNLALLLRKCWYAKQPYLIGIHLDNPRKPLKYSKLWSCGNSEEFNAETIAITVSIKFCKKVLIP